MIRDHARSFSERGVTPPLKEGPRPLSGLVVLSVGRGSPEQIAVNGALKAAGAVVLIRRSATETTQMLRAFVPSVVVTELVHDDESGSAVVRAIRGLSADDGGALPVIGICARRSGEAGPAQSEFQGLLADPFEPAEVARIVLGALPPVS